MDADYSRQFQLSGRQQIVYRSLADKSEELAELYESALRILGDGKNPGRVFLAAHSIREMTGDLPKVLDLPIPADQGRLGDKVNALEPFWRRALDSKCQNEGEWAGEIDGALCRLLKALHNFFDWLQNSRPRRREVFTAVFRKTDPSGLVLPEELEKHRVERWLNLHDYFVRVAHRASTTEEELRSQIEGLEQILQEILYPRPSEDLSAIDAILAEEAKDA
jgi:hypothetical protein